MKKILQAVERPQSLIILAIINFIAGIYSVKIYTTFISKFDFVYWFFIPTCALPLLLSALFYILLLRKKNVPILNLYCATANISYGTIMIILYPTIASIRGIKLFYVLQILFHLLMIIQGMYIWQYIKIRFHQLYIVIFWYLLKGYMDVYKKTSWYIHTIYPHLLSEYRVPVYYTLIVFQMCLVYYAYRTKRAQSS